MDNDNLLALLAHALGAVFLALPALIIWQVKKDESEFISKHARQALGFQITIFIAEIVAFALLFVLIGFVLLPAVAIIFILFTVFACIAAGKGEEYEYPKWTMIPFPFVKED